ncbi:hypothetical protein SOASR030_35480 [Leminorella grimontii]|uniref:Uncharacterized protein n=1 Tax=Leminorella grimontii TaxID=82981 RepID=A0AAV5N9B1_9GAMM|nr:hypothetical protein [Leminorella grimontii]KFC94400.1 hypothetical protein GLGR_2747 [Leminorella grimontii ATCC 33999 = DSM 5078]GKX57436.1 hypothetical protein SOASR030_35480 [Leminorella grimontii]VFS54615.1 Uncharacterised protein [Leminorella grimontii]
MKLLFFVFVTIAISMISGIIIAEISYAILLFIKYLAYGYIELEYSGILKGLKVGSTGGGILGFGIILARLLKIKGF